VGEQLDPHVLDDVVDVVPTPRVAARLAPNVRLAQHDERAERLAAARAGGDQQFGGANRIDVGGGPARWHVRIVCFSAGGVGVP
jgi:hypothetical protein